MVEWWNSIDWWQWDGIWSGVVVEGLGVLIEVCLIVWVLESVRKRRENTVLEPLRKSLRHQTRNALYEAMRSLTHDVHVSHVEAAKTKSVRGFRLRQVLSGTDGCSDALSKVDESIANSAPVLDEGTMQKLIYQSAELRRLNEELRQLVGSFISWMDAELNLGNHATMTEHLRWFNHTGGGYDPLVDERLDVFLVSDSLHKKIVVQLSNWMKQADVFEESVDVSEREPKTK